MSEQKQPFDTKTRLLCVLAYVPFLFFLPLIVASKNPRAKFHANQGLVLLIAFFVINAVIAFIDAFVTLPVAKNAIFTICNMFLLAFALLGVLHVCKEEDRPLPLIGKIKIIQ